jgi:hypothetical protein
MTLSGASRHSPIPFHRYREIHETRIDQLCREGFIHKDTLEFTWNFPPFILLEGAIFCLGELIITVKKTLKIVTVRSNCDFDVQTIEYAYNVSIKGRHNIFRYDNEDPYHFENNPYHHDIHHKHIFDVETGEQLLDSPIWVGVNRWPTLGDVIAEAMLWRVQNYHLLFNPESFA